MAALHFSIPVLKKHLLSLCFLLLILFPAGCVLGQDTGTPKSTETTDSTVPVAKGTLTLADNGPYTLDPARAAESTSGFYIMQIFSGLLRLDENMKVAGGIAERWERNIDGDTFTFHLRKDVRFHDGRLVTADDFKYSWERALNPATMSQTAPTYLGDIIGAQDILEGKSVELVGVKVLDDHTLQVTIDSPKAYFLYKMAFPAAFVIDKSNVDMGASWWEQPNGTGPFKLREWQRDELLVLEWNSEFYGDKAKVEKVVVKLLQGNSMVLYQTGEVDVTYVGAIYMDMATDDDNPLSSQFNEFPELSLFFIGFNTTIPPFDDASIRRAFSMAVDKERLISLAMRDVVSPAYGILPPGMPSYNSGLSGLIYDPKGAKELIAGSKYGSVDNLPPITITTAGMGGNISGLLGGLIEEWKTNLGVEIDVRQLEPENYYYRLKYEKDHMFDWGWIADYPDPQNFMENLFKTGTENNTGEYSNPSFDELLERAAVEQDVGKRLKMYQEAERIIVEDAACLPLFFSRSYVLVKPHVKDYMITPLGHPLLSKVYIEE